jgi:polar amino acid transport system substrate-binding protein
MTGTKTLRRRHRALPLLLGASLLAGCGDYPRDAEGSTQRARTSAMRVGVSHDPPYVVLVHGAEPRGDDIARVRALARTQGARIEWVALGHERLMEDLLAFRLHLVAGGHVANSPWQPRVGWSRKWHARAGVDGPLHERRFALPPGENAWQLEVDRFLHDHDRAAGSSAP